MYYLGARCGPSRLRAVRRDFLFSLAFDAALLLGRLPQRRDDVAGISVAGREVTHREMIERVGGHRTLEHLPGPRGDDAAKAEAFRLPEQYVGADGRLV